jgi:NAD(P)-dependent dehydrogenase (short-subunit alcohol dehydrogenase family)
MLTVVVAGASRGIGLELCRLYVAAGAQVIAGNRTQIALPGVEDIPLDVTDGQSVAAFVDALGGRPVDIFIHSAGIMGPKQQAGLKMDFEGFAQTLLVNTIGPLRMIQALVPNLRQAKAPKLVALTSIVGSMSYGKSSLIAYRASKAALNKVIQCTTPELTRLGIAVGVVHPGWTRTDMGGPNADFDAKTSAANVKDITDRLDLAVTGKFWNCDGTELAW